MSFVTSSSTNQVLFLLKEQTEFLDLETLKPTLKVRNKILWLLFSTCSTLRLTCTVTQEVMNKFMIGITGTIRTKSPNIPVRVSVLAGTSYKGHRYVSSDFLISPMSTQHPTRSFL